MLMLRFGGDIVQRATERAAATGPLPNSLCAGTSGLVTGYIGELCVNEYLRSGGIRSEIRDSYEYDILAGADVRLEVKTLRVRCDPLAPITNPVLAKKHMQDAHFYVFVRIKYEDDGRPEFGGRGYFCGALPCSQLRTRATLCRPGDLIGGFPVRYASWHVSLSDCLPWSSLVTALGMGMQKDAICVQEAARAVASPRHSCFVAAPAGSVSAAQCILKGASVVINGECIGAGNPGATREDEKKGDCGSFKDDSTTEGTSPSEKRCRGDGNTPRAKQMPSERAPCKCRLGLMCYMCCTTGAAPVGVLAPPPASASLESSSVDISTRVSAPASKRCKCRGPLLCFACCKQG